MAIIVNRRKATLEVFLDGVLLNHVVQSDWSGAFDAPYNECKVRLTKLPEGFDPQADQDLPLEIVAGNSDGLVHVRRFIGLARSPMYELSGYKTLAGVSTLEQVYRYENSDDPTVSGGLFLEDFLPGAASSCTDEEAVQAVLTLIGVDYDPADIGGTGMTFALGNGLTPTDDAYFWAAGDSPEGFPETQSAGESALGYIYRWDRVSAVAPGPWAPAGSEAADSTGAITAPVGFYRTYQTMQGTIRRTLIGGRPRGTPTITTPFEEGIDIRGGTVTRGYPTANRFLAIGFDFGGVGGQSGPVRFVMQSANPFMGSRKFTAPPVSSPMIEKQAENDWVGGMSCEKVCKAMEPEFNRIIVTGDITTSRDDYVSPGATILVQGPGGAPNILGTGENVWTRSCQGSVGYSKGFEQTFTILGGGIPDTYLPPVPQD